MDIRTAIRGRFLSIAFTIAAAALLATPSQAQIAAGKSKWLGNVTRDSVPSNFGTYWNQVTPENSTKWGSVEGTRNQMNWAAADAAYNWAQPNGYTFKFHTFIWGSQFPNWLTNSGLTQAQQRAEIEQWMQLACQRYPNTFAIDVVNEPIKTPLPFTAALGGTGSTGWDWVITSFQLARQYCPNAKLLINEYGTENDPPVRATYKTIINLLKTRGLIDGMGIQAHHFNIDNMNRAAVTTMLNDYATLALDVYVSELDVIASNTDASQLAKYQDVFPGFWEHSSVKGVTLWGYIVGETWRDGTGLVTVNGTERPAMVWLKGMSPVRAAEIRSRRVRPRACWRHRPRALRCRWPGPRPRTTWVSRVTRSCALPARVAARSPRSAPRRPTRSPTRASRRALPTASRYVRWMLRPTPPRFRTP